MNLLKGLTKIALSPLKGVVEVVKDISGENGEAEQGTSIITAGTTSVLKGTFKGIKEGVDDIFTN